VIDPRADSAPSTGTTVRGEDWYARDLGDADRFSEIAFIDVDFMEVKSHTAWFADCTFTSCRFNCSVHDGSGFVNCTFTQCSFFDSTFTQCKLLGSAFRRCTFGAFTITGGDWSFVDLTEADLIGSTITGVRMREIDLTGAQCSRATVRNVDLSGALLGGTNLSGTDLRGSLLTSLDPLNAVLADAVVTGDQAAAIAAMLGLDVRTE